MTFKPAFNLCFVLPLVNENMHELAFKIILLKVDARQPTSKSRQDSALTCIDFICTSVWPLVSILIGNGLEGFSESKLLTFTKHTEVYRGDSLKSDVSTVHRGFHGWMKSITLTCVCILIAYDRIKTGPSSSHSISYVIHG